MSARAGLLTSRGRSDHRSRREQCREAGCAPRPTRLAERIAHCACGRVASRVGRIGRIGHPIELAVRGHSKDGVLVVRVVKGVLVVVGVQARTVREAQYARVLRKLPGAIVRRVSTGGRVGCVPVPHRGEARRVSCGQEEARHSGTEAALMQWLQCSGCGPVAAVPRLHAHTVRAGGRLHPSQPAPSFCCDEGRRRSSTRSWLRGSRRRQRSPATTRMQVLRAASEDQMVGGHGWSLVIGTERPSICGRISASMKTLTSPYREAWQGYLYDAGSGRGCEREQTRKLGQSGKHGRSCGSAR